MTKTKVERMSSQELRQYNRENKRAERERKRELGLVQVTGWVAPQHRAKVLEYITALNEHSANDAKS